MPVGQYDQYAGILRLTAAAQTPEHSLK